MDAFKVLFISIRIVPIPTFTFTTRQHAQNSTTCFQFFRGNFMYAMYWEEKLKASYIYWVPEYKSTFWLCPAVYGIILCWFYYYSNFFTFMYGTRTEVEQRDSGDCIISSLSSSCLNAFLPVEVDMLVTPSYKRSYMYTSIHCYQRCQNTFQTKEASSVCLIGHQELNTSHGQTDTLFAMS